MIDKPLAILIAITVPVVFGISGVIFARRKRIDLEGFLIARNSVNGPLAMATLVASVIGAWVLLGPAETGTWAGITGIIGYSVGQAAPLLAFVYIGPRMRRLMPEGHSLTEFVWHRYGSTMHLFVLIIIVFYMFIFLSAELTGISKAFNLLSGMHLGMTAVIVGILTVAYTAYGGIRASIFTDGIQFVLILPLIIVVFIIAVVALGFGEALTPIRENHPNLLSMTYRPGIEFGLTLAIAVLAANMFHQGFWQRVYSCKDEKTLKIGFAVAGFTVVPIICLAGLLGIMAVGLGSSFDASVALFSLSQEVMADWGLVIVLVLALVLVMSSMDTLLNGIASAITTDLSRFRPKLQTASLLSSSRMLTVVLVVPAILIAWQGYSVLYLFLIADVVCAAVVFPVFWGLYARNFSGTSALLSSVCGLVAGLLFFPTSEAPYILGWIIDINWASQLLVSFSAALGISMLLSLIFSVITRCSSEPYSFNFEKLRQEVTIFTD
ncbi:Na+/proline symporter [SAR202 cluster bacterium AD-804-J14_MRT_500m]|nr:Na+/proline symporter [SAR202 cluster bacterium AD-804-J14_MRT_500m]